MFGIATAGGTLCTPQCNCQLGCGVFFELNKRKNDWAEHVLYAFCLGATCTDGMFPDGPLLPDGKNAFIGTTARGGATDGGTLFRVERKSRKAVETVLYNFCTVIEVEHCTDGQRPESGVIRDASGDLLGTAELGGNLHEEGMVFRFRNAKIETVHAFCPSDTKCRDGAEPQNPLIFDTAGRIFGTTKIGGKNGGVLFEIDP